MQRNIVKIQMSGDCAGLSIPDRTSYAQLVSRSWVIGYLEPLGHELDLECTSQAVGDRMPATAFQRVV